MLKIGEFARLSGLTVKTLHYYDRIGLLKPNGVDVSSGYRFYTEAQLLTVKRIAAFKEQGFKLEEIIPFLEEELPKDHVRERLLAKQDELRRLIEESERQLQGIDERLYRAAAFADAQEEEHAVTIRSVEPQLAASIRDTVPITQLCLLLDEVSQYVRSHDEPSADKLIVIKHGQQGNEADLEVAVPITRTAIPGTDRVRIGYLPGLPSAASLVHRCDPYRDCCPAAERVASWIHANGYARAEGMAAREVYMTSDQDVYGRTRLTELLIPLK